jgi:hypothetical protein
MRNATALVMSSGEPRRANGASLVRPDGVDGDLPAAPLVGERSFQDLDGGFLTRLGP